jgi:hypothetical protein
MSPVGQVQDNRGLRHCLHCCVRAVPLSEGTCPTRQSFPSCLPQGPCTRRRGKKLELDLKWKRTRPGALSPPPAKKEKTAFTILIWHGLMSETVETGSLEDFKRLAKEFVASTLRKVKTTEAFTDFSMMEVSAAHGFLGFLLHFCSNNIADPFI